MSDKIYGERDLMAMDIAGNHYCRHVSAMTREGLDSKSDIAAELGWRDMQIAALQQKLDAANAYRARFAVQCAAAKIAVRAAQAAGFECTLNTPAVDTFLNEVRAEGVEMLAKAVSRDRCHDRESQMEMGEVFDFAIELAAQMRAGEAK